MLIGGVLLFFDLFLAWQSIDLGPLGDYSRKGWYGAAGASLYEPTDPVRILDTRDGTNGGPSTPLAAGTPLDLKVTGGPRSVPDSATAVILTVTALGRCFRWESTNFATCERLWDFSLREIMFVGSAEWVQRRRSEAMTQVQAIVEQLRLDAWIETANDPFFVTRFASKRYHQLLTQAKFELRLSLPYSGTSLAAASFNVHQEFFGRSFAVRTPEGGFASTGCVGFGLERWVWVLFAQHGPRIAGWPGEVRDALAL